MLRVHSDGKVPTAKASARRPSLGSQSCKDFNKDRLKAQDMKGRSSRLASLKERRLAASLAMNEEDEAAPPLVRAPRRHSTASRMKAMPDSSSKAWHRKKVEQIFHDYDYNKLGEVSLHDLQKSFAEMNMAIDAETFGQYKQGLLASNCDSVDLKSFVAFHQAVWENQPPAVRRFAGCPEVTSGDGSLCIGRSPKSTTRLPGLKLGSPSKGLLNEALDNEDQLRAAFYRYTHGQLYLSRSQMPAVLKDLGITIPSADACQLDKDFFQTFCDHEFNSADENKDGKVSFQECIAYQNRYLSMMQATSLGIIKSFRHSVLATSGSG